MGQSCQSILLYGEFERGEQARFDRTHRSPCLQIDISPRVWPSHFPLDFDRVDFYLSPAMIKPVREEL